MSVRAYRLIEIRTSKNASIDLCQDNKLNDYLDEQTNFYHSTSYYEADLVDVPVKVLKKAIKKSEELNIDKQTIKQLKRDVSEAMSRGDDFVTYYCV